MTAKLIFLITIVLLLVSSGCNNPSGGSVVSAAHTPLLKPPGNFQFSNSVAANDNVTINWTPSERVSSYRLFWGKSSNSITTDVSSLVICNISNRTCSLKLSELDPADPNTTNATHYFTVDAVNVAGTTRINSSIAIKPVKNFAIDTSSPPTVGSGSLTFSWVNSVNATRYNVLFGTGSGSYSGIRENVTSPYTLTGLSNGAKYYIRVVALNDEKGYLLSSNEINGTPMGIPTTPIISNFGQGLIEDVQLNWMAVPGVTSYKIYRGTTSGSLNLIHTESFLNSFQDTSVTPGTTYFYALKNYNGFFESPLTSEYTIRPIENFNMNSVSSGPEAQQLTISWPSVIGASSYNIIYGTSPSAMNSRLTNQTSPSIISGLTGGTTYYIKVEAINNVGVGVENQSTNTLSGAPIVALPAPTGLTAQATPGQIDLSWNAVPGSSRYEVLKATTSGGPYTSLSTNVGGTSYSDNSVSNGTGYYYVVRSFNGLYSGNSIQASAKPIESFSVGAAVTVSNSSLTLSWASAAGADSYDVVYGAISGGPYPSTSTGTTTTRTFTGLTANTSYYFVVKAKNTLGSGAQVSSNQVSGKTATAAPSSLSASATAAQVTFSWSAPAGATSFKIYRSTISGSANYTEIESSVTASPYVDSSVSNGTTYFYAVKANNGSDSAYSSEVSVRPIANFSISGTSVASATSATITWGAAAGASSYNIRYGTSAGALSSTATNVTSPATISSLNSGGTYYFSVRAINSVGGGTQVDTATQTLTLSSAAPTGVVAAVATDQITISWNSVSTATSYKVYRGTASGSHTELANGITGLSYVDTSVTNGTQYYYVVRAFNGAESVNSSEVTGKPIEDFTITSTSAPSSSSISVAWPVVAGAATYEILYRSNPTGAYTSLNNRTSASTMSSLLANTTYYIKVRAKNAIGLSTFVDSSEVTQITPVSTPAGLAVTGTNGAVNLSWNATTGASSYQVFRATSSGDYSTALATGITGTTYTDSTAATGTTYFYVIQAFNGANSANSNEVSIRPVGTFSITSAVVLSSSSVELTWPSVSGATSYDIKYGTNPASLSTLNSQTSPKTFTGLSGNATYYFIVVANNTVGAGVSQESNQAQATTAFGAPTGLTASASPSQIGLNWNSVSGASTYKIYRGETSGSRTFLASSSTNAYLDTTVVNGTSYYYTVRADNGTESADSSEVAVKPIGSFTLTAGTSTAADTIALTWGSATGADSYDVRYGTSTGVYLTTVSNVTSPYNLTGLTSGTTYYISIQAKNSVGASTSLNSNERNAKTGLGAPATLTLAATSGSVAVSWSAVSGANNYNLYRGTSTGSYSQIASAISGSSYTDTVTNGTTYFYVVRTYNGIESVNSTERSVQSIASFSVGSATATSSTTMDVSWSSTTGGVTYDVLYRPTSGGATTTLTNQTSPLTISGLAAATQYSVSIRANNTIGVTTSFTTVEATATTATADPTGLAATTTPGQVSLSWSAVTGATGFKIYRGANSGILSLIATVSASPRTYTDSSVINGSQYYYVVKATNGSDSANSNEVTITPISSFTISTVSVLSSSSLEISFQAAAGASAYDLYYKTSTGSYGTPVTNVTSPHTLSSLSPNTTYVFKVTARNAIGSGTSFTTAEVSQITPVAAPTGLAAAGGTGTVNLTWNAASGATNYKVYRGTVSGSLSLLTSGVSATSYSDSTAANGTQYFYKVSSFNGADSAQSSEVTAKPIASFSLSSLTSPNSTSLTASWAAVSGADSYDITWRTSTGSYGTPVTGVTSPYTITGLAAGTTYFVRVVAKNAIGLGTSINSIDNSAATNSVPLIGSVAAQTTDADVPKSVSVSISDANDLLSCSSSLSGTSSNTTVLPNANITFSGTLPNCSVTVTPAAGQSGSATVTLGVSDGKDSATTSFNLSVTPCTVASIAWATHPTATIAGQTWASAPKVNLLKGDGSICTSTADPVSLGISIDTSTNQDATLGGVISVTPVNGTVTFSGAFAKRVGTGFTLIATQGSLSTMDSSTFNVTAGAASNLSFAQQPLTSGQNESFIPAPTVQTTDAWGNTAVPSSSVTVTLALMDNTEGATLARTGGLTSTTNASGLATFSGLSVNLVGSYFIRATAASYTSADSATFGIIPITLRNTHVAIEMLSSPFINTSNGNNIVTTVRAHTPIGSNFINGLSDADSVTFQVVANRVSSNATVYLRVGTTDVASKVLTSGLGITEVSFNPNATQLPPDGVWNIALSRQATIYAARLIIRQKSASRSQSYIPFLSIQSNSATGGISTTSITNTRPAEINMPTYDWDGSKVTRIDSALLHFVSKVTSGSACATLFNKTTNTAIGSEICNTSTTESAVSLNIPASDLPASTAELEMRVRSTAGGTASFYKMGLFVRIVNIKNMISVQQIASAKSAIPNSTIFSENQAKNYTSDTSFYYGTGVSLTQFLRCRAKANVSGTGTFGYKTNTSTPSSVSFTNQTTFSNIKSSSFNSLAGNVYSINFSQSTGNSYELSSCYHEVNAAY